MLGLYEEGMQQVEESVGVYEGLNEVVGQAMGLVELARLLWVNDQFCAAGEAATRAIDLLPKKGQEFLTCQCHILLGNIYRSKGEREKAIHHFDVAIEIASLFDWHSQLFWTHYSLVELCRDENDFNNAHAHIERAKSHVGEYKYFLGRVTELQAWVWYQQHKLGEARSEAIRANDIYGELGLVRDVQRCIDLLQKIGKTAGRRKARIFRVGRAPVVSSLETMLPSSPTNDAYSASMKHPP
jgi:tetratricopeptide (TPR) repeat protein